MNWFLILCRSSVNSSLVSSQIDDFCYYYSRRNQHYFLCVYFAIIIVGGCYFFITTNMKLVALLSNSFFVCYFLELRVKSRLAMPAFFVCYSLVWDFLPIPRHLVPILIYLYCSCTVASGLVAQHNTSSSYTIILVLLIQLY